MPACVKTPAGIQAVIVGGLHRLTGFVGCKCLLPGLLIHIGNIRIAVDCAGVTLIGKIVLR